MKYLLLFAFLGVVWWVWKKRQDIPPPLRDRKDLPPENMVVCAHCGVHLPESDAVRDGDHAYCSPAHRLAANPGKR